MEIVFLGINNELLELPLVQQVGEITCESGDEEFITVNGTTLNLVGREGLRSFTYSSILPSKRYEFIPLVKFKSPQLYINFFENYRAKGLPLRVIIYDGYKIILNMLCRVNFTYTLRDKAGDVPYTLEVKEYINPSSLNLGGVINV